MAMAQAAGADFSTIVILAGGNRELQKLVDQVVIRSMRVLGLREDTRLQTPWTDGYRDVLDLLERGDRARAVARYRQIYPQFRKAVERALLPGEGAKPA
jgi:DNA-binding GntR family transcriptional regulator